MDADFVLVGSGQWVPSFSGDFLGWTVQTIFLGESKKSLSEVELWGGRVANVVLGSRCAQSGFAVRLAFKS